MKIYKGFEAKTAHESSTFSPIPETIFPKGNQDFRSSMGVLNKNNSRAKNIVPFGSTLKEAALAAGIKVPPDNEAKSLYTEYPHWVTFISIQDGRPLPYPTAHFDNAKLIASLSKEMISVISVKRLEERGLQ